MEPITTLIVTAAALGAAAGLKSTAEQVVKDAYTGFKRVIIDHYGDYRDLIDSLEFLAKKPEDANRQAAFGDELTAAGVTKDPTVIEAARAIHAAIEAHNAETYAAIGLDIEKIKARILEVKDVQARGTGVRVKEAEIEGKASFEGIRAGQARASDPNP